MQTIIYSIELPSVGEIINVSNINGDFVITSLESTIPPYDNAIIRNLTTGESSRIIIKSYKWQIDGYSIPHTITFNAPRVKLEIGDIVKISNIADEYVVENLEENSPDNILIKNILTGSISRIIFVNNMWQVDNYSVPHKLEFIKRQEHVNLTKERTCKFNKQHKNNVKVNELEVVGQPMFKRVGSDTYSYILTEIIKSGSLIKAARYDFIDNKIPSLDEIKELKANLYKKNPKQEGYGEYKLDDKNGKYKFEATSKYRHFSSIYLSRNPIHTNLDPNF